MSDTICEGGCPNCGSTYAKYLFKGEDEEEPVLNEEGEQLCCCRDCGEIFCCSELKCHTIEFFEEDENGGGD